MGIRKRWIVSVLLLVLIATTATGREAGEATEGLPAEPVLERIDVEIPEDATDARALVAMARSLIVLRTDEPFSPRKFEASVEALRKSGLFRKIDVPDPDFDADRIVLIFRLVPAPRIRNIVVRGGFPLLEREILAAMTVFTGDAYRKPELEASREALVELFRQEGYIDPRIRVTGEPEAGDYVVRVDIEKGPFFRVEVVEIRGNRAFSGIRLKLRLDTAKAALLPRGMGRFAEKAVEADRENLLAFYRGRGFPEAEVEASVEKRPDDRSARIVFAVNEGPRYRIEFEGNEAFWNRTLKKDLVLAERGNASGLGMRRSLRNIQERYREAGFLRARVRTEEETEETDDGAVRRIRILVEEGPRSVVREIALEGAEAIPEKKLRGQILTRTPGILAKGGYVPSVVEEDRKAIRAMYRKEGFLETEVTADSDRGEATPEGERPVSVAFRVDEGERTLVASVDFEGLTVLDPDEVRKALALKVGEPYRDFMVSSDESVLSERISEAGRPHVSVTGRTRISEDGRRAEVTYVVDEGPFVETGEIFFTGNFRTRERILRRESALTPGEPFSLKAMLGTERNFREIAALETVYYTPLGLEERAERVNLLVTVEERKPYLFEVGAGYDTAREFFVKTRLENRNLLGLNLRGWLSGEYSGIGYRVETGVAEPRLFGTRIETTLSFFAEEQEDPNQGFGVRSYGAGIGFGRPLGRHIDASLNFRYESREQYVLDGRPILPEDAALYEQRSLLVTTPAVTYDSTDSFVRPTRGARLSASVDISTGLENSLDDFFKYRLDGRYYYSPLDRLTFALRGRYGYIDPFGTDSTVPDDQLFFLGGIGDVRGFRENRLRFDENGSPVGGREALLGGLEARYDLGLNFEVALFLDTGAIREPPVDAGLDKFRSAAGLGLRYHTPIGPIGLLYGRKLDPEENESAGRFHFSIGYSF